MNAFLFFVLETRVNNIFWILNKLYFSWLLQDHLSLSHFFKGLCLLHFQGFFQALCRTTVFGVQIKFVKGRKPFLTPKTWRNQQGFCRVLWVPQLVQGRALLGVQEVKHQEARHIWTLRISYFSLKSVILC